MQNRNQGSGLTGSQINSQVREEDLEELEGFEKSLEDLVHKAREDGRVFMLQEYTVILANVSAKCSKIRTRFKRENLAYLRKEGRRLKDEARGQSGEEE